MEQLYCTIFIVDVSQNPEEVETISSRIIQLIEDHGGVIKRHNPWGKRRLAYPIRNRTSAFYIEIEFTANSRLNIPKTIENEYRLNDRVLRHLTYVVSKKELLQRELDAKRAKRYEEEAYEETPQDVSENDVMGPVEEKGQAEAPEIQEVQEESKEQPPKEEPPVDESVSKEESSEEKKETE